MEANRPIAHSETAVPSVPSYVNDTGVIGSGYLRPEQLRRPAVPHPLHINPKRMKKTASGMVTFCGNPNFKSLLLENQTNMENPSVPGSVNELERNTDLTILCKDGALRVHRFVLFSISEYSRELLKDAPRKNAEIILPDYSIEALRRVFTMLYMGYVPSGNQVEQYEAEELAESLGITNVRLKKMTDREMEKQKILSFTRYSGFQEGWSSPASSTEGEPRTTRQENNTTDTAQIAHSSGSSNKDLTSNRNQHNSKCQKKQKSHLLSVTQPSGLVILPLGTNQSQAEPLSIPSSETNKVPSQPRVIESVTVTLVNQSQPAPPSIQSELTLPAPQSTEPNLTRPVTPSTQSKLDQSVTPSAQPKVTKTAPLSTQRKSDQPTPPSTHPKLTKPNSEETTQNIPPSNVVAPVAVAERRSDIEPPLIVKEIHPRPLAKPTRVVRPPLPPSQRVDPVPPSICESTQEETPTTKRNTEGSTSTVETTLKVQRVEEGREEPKSLEFEKELIARPLPKSTRVTRPPLPASQRVGPAPSSADETAHVKTLSGRNTEGSGAPTAEKTSKIQGLAERPKESKSLEVESELTTRPLGKGIQKKHVPEVGTVKNSVLESTAQKPQSVGSTLDAPGTSRGLDTLVVNKQSSVGGKGDADCPESESIKRTHSGKKKNSNERRLSSSSSSSDDDMKPNRKKKLRDRYAVDEEFTVDEDELNVDGSESESQTPTEESDVDEDKDGVSGGHNYETRHKNRAPSYQESSDSDDMEEPTHRPPARTRSGVIHSDPDPDLDSDEDFGNYSCFFCESDSPMFGSQKQLVQHLSQSSCASHITVPYNLKERRCGYCKKRFRDQNCYGFLKHVHGCEAKHRGDDSGEQARESDSQYSIPSDLELDEIESDPDEEYAAERTTPILKLVRLPLECLKTRGGNVTKGLGTTTANEAEFRKLPLLEPDNSVPGDGTKKKPVPRLPVPSPSGPATRTRRLSKSSASAPEAAELPLTSSSPRKSTPSKSGKKPRERSSSIEEVPIATQNIAIGSTDSALLSLNELTSSTAIESPKQNSIESTPAKRRPGPKSKTIGLQNIYDNQVRQTTTSAEAGVLHLTKGQSVTKSKTDSAQDATGEEVPLTTGSAAAADSAVTPTSTPRGRTETNMGTSKSAISETTVASTNEGVQLSAPTAQAPLVPAARRPGPKSKTYSLSFPTSPSAKPQTQSSPAPVASRTDSSLPTAEATSDSFKKTVSPVKQPAPAGESVPRRKPCPLSKTRNQSEASSSSSIVAASAPGGNSSTASASPVPGPNTSDTILTEDEILMARLKCPVCKIPYTKIAELKRCVRDHGRQHCLVCGDAIAKDLPNSRMVYHMHCEENNHFLTKGSNKIKCPVSGCGKIRKYTGMNQHIISEHLEPSIRRRRNSEELTNEERFSEATAAAVEFVRQGSISAARSSDPQNLTGPITRRHPQPGADSSKRPTAPQPGTSQQKKAKKQKMMEDKVEQGRRTVQACGVEWHTRQTQPLPPVPAAAVHEALRNLQPHRVEGENVASRSSVSPKSNKESAFSRMASVTTAVLSHPAPTLKESETEQQRKLITTPPQQPEAIQQSRVHKTPQHRLSTESTSMQSNAPQPVAAQRTPPQTKPQSATTQRMPMDGTPLQSSADQPPRPSADAQSTGMNARSSQSAAAQIRTTPPPPPAAAQIRATPPPPAAAQIRATPSPPAAAQLRATPPPPAGLNARSSQPAAAQSIPVHSTPSNTAPAQLPRDTQQTPLVDTIRQSLATMRTPLDRNPNLRAVQQMPQSSIYHQQPGSINQMQLQTQHRNIQKAPQPGPIDQMSRGIHQLPQHPNQHHVSSGIHQLSHHSNQHPGSVSEMPRGIPQLLQHPSQQPGPANWMSRNIPQVSQHPDLRPGNVNNMSRGISQVPHHLNQQMPGVNQMSRIIHQAPQHPNQHMSGVNQMSRGIHQAPNHPNQQIPAVDQMSRSINQVQRHPNQQIPAVNQISRIIHQVPQHPNQQMSGVNQMSRIIHQAPQHPNQHMSGVNQMSRSIHQAPQHPNQQMPAVDHLSLGIHRRPQNPNQQMPREPNQASSQQPGPVHQTQHDHEIQRSLQQLVQHETPQGRGIQQNSASPQLSGQSQQMSHAPPHLPGLTQQMLHSTPQQPGAAKPSNFPLVRASVLTTTSTASARSALASVPDWTEFAFAVPAPVTSRAAPTGITARTPIASTSRAASAAGPTTTATGLNEPIRRVWTPSTAQSEDEDEDSEAEEPELPAPRVVERQVDLTCDICSLVASNKEELDDHLCF